MTMNDDDVVMWEKMYGRDGVAHYVLVRNGLATAEGFVVTAALVSVAKNWKARIEEIEQFTEFVEIGRPVHVKRKADK